MHSNPKRTRLQTDQTDRIADKRAEPDGPSGIGIEARNTCRQFINGLIPLVLRELLDDDNDKDYRTGGHWRGQLP